MKTNTNRKKILTMVEMAMLIALVVVLQLISAIVPPIGGSVSITLTLIPVVVGAIIFGYKGGAVLGLSFGVIVLINCITGLDIGGNILWNANPFITATLCILKGVFAGIAASIVYNLIKGKSSIQNRKRNFFAALSAAMIAPIVNTGLFVCGMLLFFMETLQAWAGGSDLASYILLTLAGWNFLIEFLINIILTPSIIRIVDAVKKK